MGAHFCEVKIDPLLPRVQVTRVVSVMNCGRIVSAKTARSQIMGGVTMGIGMALMEETSYDPATGLPVISSNWPAAWWRRRSKPSATAAPVWRAAVVRGVGQG